MLRVGWIRGVKYNFRGFILVEFMYHLFTRMPGENYRRRLRCLLLCLLYTFERWLTPLLVDLNRVKWSQVKSGSVKTQKSLFQKRNQTEICATHKNKAQRDSLFLTPCQPCKLSTSLIVSSPCWPQVRPLRRKGTTDRTRSFLVSRRHSWRMSSIIVSVRVSAGWSESWGLLVIEGRR